LNHDQLRFDTFFRCVWLLHEIRATVYGQEILIVEAANAGIATAAASDGAKTADPLEILFQHSGIVIEVLAVSALPLARCILFTRRLPSGQIHDEKSYEAHRLTMKDLGSFVDRG
jgi:hypothetical protein